MPHQKRFMPKAILFHIRQFAIRKSHIAISFFLPFLFFWRLFAPNAHDRVWLPEGDLTQQYFPLRIEAARQIAEGHLPLWNPHMYAGQPALADSQMAVLYPINLITDIVLAWLHQPFTFFIFELQIVLHVALAALFTYAFAMRLTRSRFAAWVAALVFTFGGYLISYPVQQPAILESAVWLPLVLLLLDYSAEQFLLTNVIASEAKQSPSCDEEIASAQNARLAMTRGVAGLILAGTSLALSILAGHPQTNVYVFYTALAYWLMANRRWLMDERNTHHALRISSFILQTSAFLLFAFGLSAVQWLPTLEFTRLSTRAQLGYAFTSTGFAPHEIITLLVPGYFGGSPLYVGIIPLLLVGAALLAVNGEPSTVNRARPFTVHSLPFTAFWLLLALVALFLSFGDSSFVYSLFYWLAPGFALVRDQERAALLWSFALAMLAAIGAASLGRRSADGGGGPSNAAHRPPSAVVFGGLLLVLTVLIALAYVGALASEAAHVEVNLFPGALRQLLPDLFFVLGAWALWRAYTHTHSARRWIALGALALLGLQLFSVNGSYNFQKPTPPDYFPATPLARALREELQTHPLARVASEGLLPGAHNAGAEYGFEDVGGNDPLSLQSFAQFNRQVIEPRKLQLLNVGALISKRDLASDQFTLVTSDGDVHLYRFNGALPRAWLVHNARVVAPDKIYETLNGDDFDPSRSVALIAQPTIVLSATVASADAVEIVHHAAGQLSVRARTSADGVLVVSEIFYPGWKARVDGQPASLLPADGVLMALPLASGAHQIELTFEPDLVKIGTLISIVSVLSCVGLALWAWRSG